MADINFIVNKPTGTPNASGQIAIERGDVILPSISISQYEKAQFNVALQGFTNATSVSISLEFPNGDVITNMHLVSLINSPSLFTLDLTDAITDKLNIGDKTYVKITNLVIADDGYSYELALGDEYDTNQLQFGLYRTNTSASYTPTDMEKLFICINELQKKVNELEEAINATK